MTTTAIRSYPARWQGGVILACRKGQKKLKRKGHATKLAKLKKMVNKRNAEPGMHILNVACMELCPKNGVTVCVPSLSEDRLTILRGEADLDSLRA